MKSSLILFFILALTSKSSLLLFAAGATTTTTTTTTTSTDTDTTRTTTSGSNHKNKISSSTSISLQQQQQTNANAKNGNDSNNTNGGDGTPGMPILPKGVVKYSQVPKEGKQFTGTTIPSGLLKTHTTKKGTWGVIRVSQGLLEYSIPIPNPKAKSKSKSKAKATDDDDDDDDQDQKYAFELSKDFHGIIEPLRLHQVRPLTPDVEFVVEFMRLPNTGPVDEKREGL